MKVKAIAEACMWLPGFGPDEDPLQVLGIAGSTSAPVIKAIQTLCDPFVDSRPAQPKAIWPKLDASNFDGLFGAVTKYEANILAIKTLRELEKDDREPSAQERTILNRYTGWGGLPEAFNCEQRDEAWAKRSNDLKALLSEPEYESAMESTPNAHFTPVEVVGAMWGAIRRLGFDGGRIVEPAAGVGYFLGAMPEDVARNSQVTTVELDSLSARIVKALYKPYGVATHHCGLESSPLPTGFYDLVIGNVPFGNVQVPEMRNVPFANFSIHNYFFAKALELVRPGGLVAFITSSFTLDANSNAIREYLAGEGKLLAAIRLPNTTFKQIASTDVTTDILILQKHLAPVSSTEGCGWMDVEIVPSASPINGGTYYSDRVAVNEHFIAHPKWVIGKLSSRSGQYGRSVTCAYEGNLSEALQERVDMLPQGVYQPQKRATKQAPKSKDECIQLEGVHRPGLALIDGKVYEIKGETATLSKSAGKTLDRLVGLIQIRDSARKLIAMQPVVEDEGMLSVYRTALNVAYDAHTAKHGYIHVKTNRQAFAADPDLPLLLSLEQWNDKSQTAEKTPIFTRRTVGVCKRVSRCESAVEALQVVLGETGHADANRIAELVGKPIEEVMQRLEDGGHVFHDPQSDTWEHADVYLSGTVRAKLAVAKASGERYARNVEALEKVQPQLLTPSEISARIGSTWIPMSVYAQFLDEVFKVNGHKVAFEASVGTWDLDAPHRARFEVTTSQIYGTGRANGVDLFEQALNQREPTIYDKVGDKQVANAKETIAAREKQYALKEKFVEWIWSDEPRANRLTALYNEQFNSKVPRQFNGEHLVLPGMSQMYTLRTHQRDAVWRILSSGHNTLLAHAVGAGKTLEMVCAGMELRRLGMASKVMYVVPNHMLLQFSHEFMQAYPNAKILMASKDDLVGDKRRELLSRIATSDWDAVVVTQATFERIKMSDDYMKSYIKDEISNITMAIRQRGNAGRGNAIVKQLARAKKAWTTKLDKMKGTAKKDDMLNFEDLGIDWLMVDESHFAKNLWRFSKMDRIAGLPNTNSERAFDLFVKTRYVRDKRDDRRGTTFASGTPISNTMAEMWVVMRYLMQDTLEAHMIDNFDSWAANFGESVTALELAPDGNGYRMQARFARFVNMPELMGLFRMVADIRTPEMLDLPVPKAHKVTVTTPPSESLKRFVESLVERAEEIRSGGVKPSEDNMLAITGDGRKAALDMRMVDPLEEDDETGKIQLCANNVHRIWTETGDSKGVQLVFCDLSTPRNDGQFSAYNDLRMKLVCMGIPSHEIAFIHDYDTDSLKASLFASVRSGAVRVLMGSTAKMGVGTNVQDKLVALHHLDSPWRPSDLEQREGRIIRQGNLNEEVWIYTYIREGSFDAYMYQLLHSKAKFIAQVMSGGSALRSVEDAELAALSFAEIKALASGNPLVLEKAGVDSELARLSVVRQSWERQNFSNKADLARLPMTIKGMKAEIANIEADVAAASAVAFDAFSMNVLGAEYSDKEKAANAVMDALMKTPLRKDQEIGTFLGFKIEVYQTDELYWSVTFVGNHEYTLGHTKSGDSLVRMVQREIRDLPRHLAVANERLQFLERRMVDLEVEVAKTFDKQDRIDELRKRQIEIDTALDLSKGDLTAVDELEQSEEALEV